MNISQSDHHPILKKENLLKVCISYLNCKDLSQIAQVNKNLNRISDKFFDHYWREAAISFFSSKYDYNR